MRKNPSRKSSFCLGSPEYFPKCLRDDQDIFWANVRWAFVGALLLPFAWSLSYCWTINTDVNWDKEGLNIKKEINALCFRDDFYESYINHIIEFDKACQYFIRISNKVSRNNRSNHIKSCPELIRLSDWYCMTSSFFLGSRCLSICLCVQSASREVLLLLLLIEISMMGAFVCGGDN